MTYLLAIGNERLHDRDSLSIPVYLGDSIQLNQATSVLSTAGVTIHTTDGLEFFARELNFPESVVADASRFDPLVDELATKAARRLADGKPPAIAQTMTNFGITHDVDRAMIESTYHVLCHLHDSHRDHIWGYYVRNLARPLEFTRAAHRVDPARRQPAVAALQRDDCGHTGAVPEADSRAQPPGPGTGGHQPGPVGAVCGANH